jgi:hypothetical protein
MMLLDPQTLAVPPPPQMFGAVQVPHWIVAPHPSPIGPQFAPIDAQVLGVHIGGPASGKLPHTFGVPPPPQVAVPLHEPQFRRWPQPSATIPQVAPIVAHVLGTHCDVPPQVLGTPPPPHVWDPEHDPQSRTWPQPSPAWPQWTPSDVHVWAMHDEPPSLLPGMPHTLGPPAPQVSGSVQEPHSSRPPHKSATGPQFAPTSAQVRGWQCVVPPHTFGVPPPPQLAGAVQNPQLMRLPQPSPIMPHSAWAD